MKRVTMLKKQSGFTIVELMIATLVFSMILLTITFGVIHFTSDYYKGVNSSTTQDRARNIMDTITQAIQFTGSTPTVIQTSVTGIQYFCINNEVYAFRLGVQFKGATTSDTPGLYVSAQPSAGCAPISGVWTGGKQLLGNHMRLAALKLTPGSTLQSYNVSLRLAYSSGGNASREGDDLLCSPSISPTKVTNCNTRFVLGSEVDSDYARDDLQCRAQLGSQFCAVSALSSTVLKRVDDGN